MSEFSYVVNLSAHMSTLAALPVDMSGFATFGGGRPRSDRKKFIRHHLYASTGGRCVTCGQTVTIQASDAADSLELGHIVPGGDQGRGWCAGNIVPQCRACNSKAGNTNQIGLLPLYALNHLIVVEWPTGYAITDKTDEYARRAQIRTELGIPF